MTFLERFTGEYVAPPGDTVRSVYHGMN